jgi:hypothetical protein
VVVFALSGASKACFCKASGKVKTTRSVLVFLF